MTATDLVRREHYLDVAGPKDWGDIEVARWVLALCLRRDGRTDAVTRAGEIIPRANTFEPTLDLPIRERGALASAMYVLQSGPLEWPIVRVARIFNVQVFWAVDVIAATSSDVAEVSDFRAGITDVSLAIREAVVAKALA